MFTALFVQFYFRTVQLSLTSVVTRLMLLLMMTMMTETRRNSKYAKAWDTLDRNHWRPVPHNSNFLQYKDAVKKTR